MKLIFLIPTCLLCLCQCFSQPFRLNQTFTEEEEFLPVTASNIQINSTDIDLPISDKKIVEAEFRNQVQNQIDRLSLRSVTSERTGLIELQLISYNHKFTSDFIGVLLHFLTFTIYTFSGGVVMREGLVSEFKYYIKEGVESPIREYKFYFQCERPLRFSDNISHFQSAPDYGDYCRKKMILDLAKNIWNNFDQLSHY